MRPRIILIAIGIIIVICIVAYVVYALSGSNSAGVSGANTNGGQVTSIAQAYPNAPAGSYVTIGTTKGNVQVNNFYIASSTQIGEDGTLMLKQTSSYWISYDPSASSFWIAISGNPFNSIRPLAEADFLNTLGVSKADACKLNVSVGTPYVAGSSMNGQSFPLSFCE